MEPQKTIDLMVDCVIFCCENCNNRHRGCKDGKKFKDFSETVISALEKQIPKELNMFHCQCGMAIDDGWCFCPKCGQALRRG